MIKKYHKPIKFVLNYIAKQIKPGAKVLEIGPGFEPFEKATHFCGWTDEESKRLKNYTKVNVSEEKLPYADNEFDFVYLRHVVEDLWNPINCLNEVSRVAKEGWIETPSPICEMTRGIDGLDGISPPWRGYAHHRYIVWNDSNVLNILPKFPMIEYITFNEEELQKLLENPFNWCTFYHFKDQVNYKLYHMGRDADFVMFDGSYLKILQQGMNKSLDESMKRMRTIGVV